MTLQRSFLGSSALWVMVSGFAYADVSASDVWTDWQSMLGNYGDGVSLGVQKRVGDTLTITGIQIEGNMEDSSYTFVLPDVAMTDQDDGTVLIEMSETSSITAVFPTELGRDGEVVVGIDHNNYVITASGSPSELTYDYSIDDLRFYANEMTMGNVTVSFLFDMVMTNVTGKSIATPGALRKVTQSFAADTTTAQIDFEDPAGAGHVKVSLDVPMLDGIGTMALPEGINMMDANALQGTGYMVDGSYGFGAMKLTSDIKDDVQQMSVQSQNAGGEFTIASDDTSIEFGVSSQSPATEIRTDQLPFAIAFNSASQSSKLQMPFVPSETSKDFGLSFELNQFEMSDGLWGMFDPMAALPRTPATVALDLEGQGKWNVDLNTPNIDDLDGPVGEVDSLTLNKLLIDMVGATVEGSGGFTFDNADLATFGGIPKPVGEINLNMTGIDGLMAKLADMGLLPADQIMGARMMMGIFARPGDGPDTLTSKIEVTETGQVLANGQRIR